MFPWFFMIPIAMHRCLCIWRSSHLFQSLWSDYSKKRHSSVGGDILGQSLTWLQCGEVLWLQVLGECLFGSGPWGPRHWQPWSLGSTAGAAEATGLLMSSMVLSVPAAGDWSSGQWGPGPVVCTHSGSISNAWIVSGVSCKDACHGGGQSKQKGLEPTAGSPEALGALSVCVHLCGCWVLPQAHGTRDQCQKSGECVQMDSWRG